MSCAPNTLTESNIRDLVKLLDEEMDGVAREQRDRLQTIDGGLEEVKKQLGRVWHFIARSDSVDVAGASDLIVELRERKETLEVAAGEARAVLVGLTGLPPSIEPLWRCSSKHRQRIQRHRG